MGDTNNVIVKGRLVRDAELKYVSTGTALTNISIASEYSFKKGDEWEKKVSYFDITAWGTLAQRAANFKKGVPVVVTGRMEQQRWEKDGKTNSKVVVIADDISEIVITRKEEGTY